MPPKKKKKISKQSEHKSTQPSTSKPSSRDSEATHLSTLPTSDTDTEASRSSPLSTKQSSRTSPQPSTPKPLHTDIDPEASQLSTLPTVRTGRRSPPPSTSKTPDTDTEGSPLSTLSTTETSGTSPQPSTSTAKQKGTEHKNPRSVPMGKRQSEVSLRLKVKKLEEELKKIKEKETIQQQEVTVDKNVVGVTDGGRADSANTAAVQHIEGNVNIYGGGTPSGSLPVAKPYGEITKDSKSHKQSAEFKDEQSEPRAITSWTCDTSPVKRVSQLTNTFLQSLCRLKDWFKTNFNVFMKKVFEGSLVFVFHHGTLEEAHKMMADQDKVKVILLEFLKELNPDIEDIQLKVEIQGTEHIKDTTSVPMDKRQSEVSLLRLKVKKLEEELKKMKEEKETILQAITDVKMMLFMRHSSSAIDTSTSGYDTQRSEIKPAMVSYNSDFAHGDTESTAGTVVGDTGMKKESEENIPEESPKWMISDGESTLIYYDKNIMLYEACRKGSLKIVKELLASGADINHRSTGGWTPVMVAAYSGYKQLLDLLIQQGCDLSLTLENGNSILHLACFGGNAVIVNYIISNNVESIDSKGQYGQTAVMKAANIGNRMIFDLLVSHGCDLAIIDDVGNNILHLACCSENVDIVGYILSHHIADINSKGFKGRTPVMTAAEFGRKNVFDLLISQGCDLATIDDVGNNILHHACFSDNVDIVSYILSHHIADINRKGFKGRTPVMIAAENGRKKVFDFLVSQECDLATIDDVGNNILHLACFSDNVDIVGYILSHHIADINSKGFKGRTPVMTAAENGRKKVFDLLVSQGCGLTATDDVGNNILHHACFGDNVDIVGYILSHHIADINGKGEYGKTPVMTAAVGGRKNVFDLLISQGCDLATIDDVGNDILHLACFSDNVDIVGYILSQPIADINSEGFKGRTPVMTAAENGRKKVFDLLVSQECDLTTTDDVGNNILHHACFSDNVDIVGYILSHHIADINRKGFKGRTPVMIAAENGRKKVFDFLVCQGCDLATIDDIGNNILHLACFSDNVDIVGYILSHHIADINSKEFKGRTPVMTAAGIGRKKVFDLLISQGCDLATIDDEGNTILHLACFSDNVDIVGYILSHHIADINSKGFKGRTPVMTAAENGRKKVFDLLVSQGCDLATVDDIGNNILHLACFSDNVDIVGYILSHHIADINSRGFRGRTPVMTTAGTCQKKVFKLLADEGCDLTLVDHDNKNILHLAAAGGSVDIVTRILSEGIVDINSGIKYGRTALWYARSYKQNKVASLLVDRGATDT